MTTKKAALQPGDKCGTLADRRALFAAEYLVDRNATQAAIRAGYSRKTAKQQGSRLLTNADVRRAIEVQAAQTLAKLEVTREQVISELANIAFANLLDYGQVTEDGHFELDLSRATYDQMAALQELIVTHRSTLADDGTAQIERLVRLKLTSKREALIALGKYLGIFKDAASAQANVTFSIIGLDKAQRAV